MTANCCRQILYYHNTALYYTILFIILSLQIALYLYYEILEIGANCFRNLIFIDGFIRTTKQGM